MQELIDFEEAAFQFAEEIKKVLGPKLAQGRIVRDIFGWLSFVAPASISDDERFALTAEGFGANLAYLDMDQPIVFSDNDLYGDIISESGQICDLDSGGEFTILDRRLAGDDWLASPQSRATKPPRFAFYGLKGGVGRSTALAVASADLASRGKNVLVIDLDLEAPGLGSILLRDDRLPEYGVLDYLASAAAGTDTSGMVQDLVGGSPFTTGGGVVDVVPVIGLSTSKRSSGFFSKLARAYTPGAVAGRYQHKGFSEKIEGLINDLTELRSYDAVLLDVRAGLHETSAASLLSLGAFVFLFGVSSSQTLADYRILLLAIRNSIRSWPDAPDLRSQFRMVQARAPSSLGDHALHRVDSWKLWLETLYDAVGDEPDAEAFSFDLDDPAGPHYPWVIPNAEAYLTFDPRRSAEYLESGAYQGVFGSFIANLNRMIDDEDQV
jgi:hypothetical protein